MVVDFRRKRHYVYWSDDHIAYTGVPFMMLGTKVLDCHHGKDRSSKLKELNKKGNLQFERLLVIWGVSFLKKSQKRYIYNIYIYIYVYI